MLRRRQNDQRGARIAVVAPTPSSTENSVAVLAQNFAAAVPIGGVQRNWRSKTTAGPGLNWGDPSWTNVRPRSFYAQAMSIRPVKLSKTRQISPVRQRLPRIRPVVAEPQAKFSLDRWARFLACQSRPPIVIHFQWSPSCSNNV